MKEVIKHVIFDNAPKVRIRVIAPDDSDKIKNEKKKFPFKLDNSILVTVITNRRLFSFTIPHGYIWNGADIPRVFWRVIGACTDNEFLVASMVHDFMLEFKTFIERDVLKNSMPIKEYRRLTSLIFRHILKTQGTNTIKANIMSFCVQAYQATLNAGSWK